MKSVILFVVLSLFSFSYCATINATTADGFQTIHLESPSMLTEIHWINTTTSNVGTYYYVFGETSFKAISYGERFEALDVPRRFGLPFISVSLFHNGTSGDVFAVGPTYRDPSAAPTFGYFLPLGFSSPYESISYQGMHMGYTFYSVHVDNRNATDTLAYFVGWGPNIAQPGSVSLVLVRSHLNMDGPVHTRGFFWNNETDVIHLRNDDYVPYSANNKPHMFLEISQSRLYILDPGSRHIFSVFVPNNTVDMMRLVTELQFPTFGRLTGVAYNPFLQFLYIGLAASGVESGHIYQISLLSMRVVNQLILPPFYSNPSAMTEFNETLYVGFQEGANILRIDTHNFQITGYQRIPWYLRSLSKAFDAGHDHVYFITQEQHSKVARTHKTDFCPTSCPEFGYCQRGTCYCSPPFSMSKDKKYCEPPAASHTNTVSVDRGAAIALGILFAVAVLSAAAGWFMFYKAKGGHYTPV